MSLTALGQRFLNKVSELFSEDNKQTANTAEITGVNTLQRYGIFNFATGGVNNVGDTDRNAVNAANRTALRNLAERVAAQQENAVVDRTDDKPPARKKNVSAPLPPPIKPPQIELNRQDQPTRGFQPYQLTLIVPADQETISYEQMQNAAIKNIFERNGVGYSRASIEAVADKEKLDFSPKYNYETKQYEYNAADSLRYNGRPETTLINGKSERVVRFTIELELQRSIVGDKALSETIKASGKKTFAELNLNERMQMAMQMAYDKHYLPHDVQEALKDIDPRHLLAGVALAGGLVYAAEKGGAAEAIPIVGTAVTAAQLTYYYSLAESFVQECKRAKSPEQLDEAAQDFAALIKGGGVDLTITVATAGVAKLGKISAAGGKAVGVVEEGVLTTWRKLGKLNDEVVARMR